MQRTDLPTLHARLIELAEVLPPHRAPTEKGLLVWFDALSSFSANEVLGAISDWPRREVRMPAPAELVKALNERRSVRIEKDAEKAAHAPGFKPERLAAPTAAGRSQMERIRDILASPKPGPRDWIARLARREATGAPVAAIAAQLWRQAAGVASTTTAARFCSPARGAE